MTEWLLTAIANCFLILVLLMLITLIGTVIFWIGRIVIELISETIKKNKER